jgi:hypothetical protein
VWQFALAGPRLKVTAANAMTTNDGRWWLSIDAINKGRMPVTIADVGIAVEAPGQAEGKMPVPALHPSMWQGPPLTHRLIDGNSDTWLVAPEVVATGLIERQARPDVRGYVRLGTGKSISSRNRIDVANLVRVTR